MVIEVNGQSYTVFSMKDFEDVIGHDAYNAIIDLAEEEIIEKEMQIDNQEQELNSYEGTLYSHTHCFNDIDSETEELIDYVENAKRIDRNKLKDKLSWMTRRIHEEDF